MSLSPTERFMSKTKETETGCLEWQAYCGKDGYGEFFLEGKMWKAHRAAWHLFVCSIPAGMHLLHLCDNPRCVRVSHLKLGTHTDNMRDMVAKGRSYQNKLTHCKTCGSELVVVDFRNNKRGCVPCRKKRAQDWQMRHK